MVGYYHPLAGREEPTEASGKVALRLHGPTRLCYSDDEASMNETPQDLCRSVKSISLNEDSSLCCRARHGDSFSNEEEEETHMSWIEIMAKKRELERSLRSKESTQDDRIDSTSKSGRAKVKRSSFLSPSFKLRDLFSSTNPSVERKKTGKSKLHSRTSLVLCTSLRGRGSSNDPSPLQFDLRSRGLPAIPVQDVDANHHHSDDSADVERTLRGRSSVDRETRSNRAASNSSSGSGTGSGDFFIDSFNELKNKGWYWGPLSWKEAEEQLRDKPTGSFLVRDSSDDRYILSLTFKSDDKIHHTRIEHYRGQFSFNNQPKSLGAATIVEFIEKAIENCADGSFSYFLRPRGPGVPPTMFRLIRPVSRFTRVHSLQHLCRFVILSRIRRDMIDQLPVPGLIKKYLACTQYYIE